jgi:hypothetical protein
MTLDILGYVFGIGFVVFGISALVLWGNEIYKIISKSNKRVSYKQSIYCAGIAIICALVLVIISNVFRFWKRVENEFLLVLIKCP